MELLKIFLTSCGAAIIAGIFSLIVTNKNIKKEQAQEQNEVLKRLDKLSDKLSEHVLEDGEARTDEARLRILRFGDEVRRGVAHTEEHWADILRDIDRYERYCDAHPEYENNRATRTIEYLKNVFDEHLKENDFLR